MLLTFTFTEEDTKHTEHVEKLFEAIQNCMLEMEIGTRVIDSLSEIDKIEAEQRIIAINNNMSLITHLDSLHQRLGEYLFVESESYAIVDTKPGAFPAFNIASP